MEKQSEQGSFINRMRVARGYTQRQLGDRLGVSAGTISRWESGADVPGLEELRQLAVALGCTQEELFLGRRFIREGAESGQDVTAEYRELVKRCNCCRHEGMRFFSLFSPEEERNPKAVCKKCGAELRVDSKKVLLLRIATFLSYGFLSSVLSVFTDDLTPRDPLWSYFIGSAGADDKMWEAYFTLSNSPEMAVFTRYETIRTICVYIALFVLWSVIVYGAEKLLGKLHLYDKHLHIVRYPHPEDGKIVF